MRCRRCGSRNVRVQVVSETELKRLHHGFFWWVFIGWWWVPVKWIFFTVPALILKLFWPSRYRLRTVHRSMAVCQDCGHHWMV
ncbi:MAG: hypothetical protein IIZ39_00765 [Blautia sp.]|nr:hypothetical protein [Blautia sp.]